MIKKFLFFYFAFCVFFFSFFTSGFVDSLDGFLYLAVARRMYYDKTFELPKETFENKENIWLTPLPGKDGKVYSPTGLGYSVALLPAVFGEDLFLRAAKLTPLSAFPLQSDWPVLLFASLTNSFFGALLAIIMYLYLKTYGISHKASLLISFISLTCTNLFVYTKHTMPHMMFISFLTLTFYLVKKYSILQRPKHLFFAGVSFGITSISYNGSYIFSIIPLGIYYLLLTKSKINLNYFKRAFRDIVSTLIGFIPFYLLAHWFNSIRLGSAATEKAYISTTAAGKALLPQAYILFEGIWNVLISPGRGFLVYSPIVLVIILFWFKLKKTSLPEIISFGILFFIYTYITAVLTHGPDYPVWHGEYSWGPRYMLPLIPLLMILVGNIYFYLTKKQKLLVFLPLALLGLYLEIVGILLPYQIKFGGLEPNLYINGNYFNVTVYANEIPRFSAPFVMSKKLVRRLTDIKKIYNHGPYNLRLYDGFEYSFDLGYTKWRAVKPLAKMSFIPTKNGVTTVDLQFRNHQIDSLSKYKARIDIFLNEEKISSTLIPADKEVNIPLQLNDKGKENSSVDLAIRTSFDEPTPTVLKDKQVLFLQIVRINSIPQNIETLDFPYYSPISEKLYNQKYYYWGNENKDYYDIWNMHSGVFEQTFDLWWLRPFHYWDFPKKIFLSLFVLNILGMTILGFTSLSLSKKIHQKFY